jgi:predicted ferric reductase
MSRDPSMMRRSAMMVIDHMRRHGPRLTPWTYWHARTLILVWMLPRTLQANQWREALRMFVRAYVLNPLWWVHAEPRKLIRRIGTEGLARLLGFWRGPAQTR